MIPVTKPFLPPKEEYQIYLDGIWQRNWLTNNGPLLNELELQLKKHLNVNHLLFVGNGTLALQLAIKALNLRGEIITTPFSYIATASSIVWEACEPVFVDINSSTFNLDSAKIEEAITPKTSAILATHVFGNPCEINEIENIAKKHKLKVIYDAAHCFGTTYEGRSIYNFGDISTTSFHATKLYHTIEGGAVITQSPDLLKKLAFMRNFGHDGSAKFQEVGINAKNSEFHAAMGLCNLKYIQDILNVRKIQYEKYDHLLANLRVAKQYIFNKQEYNFAYYPIVFETEEILEKMIHTLNKHEIFPRRYFYPSLSKLDYVKQYSTPKSDFLAARVLCLPLYHELSEAEQSMIARLLLRTQNN